MHQRPTKGRPDGFQNRVPELRHSTTEDDPFGVKGVDQAGQVLADDRPGLLDNQLGEGIALDRRLADVRRSELQGLVERGAGLLCQLLGHPPADGGAGGHGFQMTELAAATARSVGVNEHVAELRRQAMCPEQQLPIHNRAAANPGPDGQKDEIEDPSAGTVTPLSQGGQVAVISQSHRTLKTSGKPISQRDAVPTRQVGRAEHNALCGVEWTGRDDSHAQPVVSGDPQCLYGLDDAQDDRLRTVLGVS